MKVALGFKAHSGWAALVVVGGTRSSPVIIDRRRIDLVEAKWAKAPYHAAEGMTPTKAAGLVQRATEMAHRVARSEIAAAVARAQAAGHEVVRCAVLMPKPMPAWSVEEIRAVHFRMHKAEGVLFPQALRAAIEASGLAFVPVPEKELDDADLAGRIGALGKSIGPPWGKDQKLATIAALTAPRRGRAT